MESQVSWISWINKPKKQSAHFMIVIYIDKSINPFFWSQSIYSKCHVIGTYTLLVQINMEINLCFYYAYVSYYCMIHVWR